MDTTTYYEKELYPLQDKVLKALTTLTTPFYLTGGTALSRFYYNHRYSDDLDLFVNKDPGFKAYAEQIIIALSKDFIVQINTRSDTFYSLLLDKKLKLDMVNDVAAHFGEIKETDRFSRVDDPINILSNKISAIMSREEPKDVVDIWIIAKNTHINWMQIFTDVASKAVGIFPPSVAEKLDTFPLQLLEKINWVEKHKPDLNVFEKDLKVIIEDILRVN